MNLICKLYTILLLQLSLYISLIALVGGDVKFTKEQIRLELDAMVEDILAMQERKMWHAYQFNSGIGNREELIIKSINSANDFNIGQQVTEWQSINVRNKSYAVGLMPTGFTVFTAHSNKTKSGFSTLSRIVDLQTEPTAFTLLKNWNINKHDYDVIVIVGLGGQDFDIHWYKITDDNNLEKIWWWHLHKKVTHLKVFDLENKQRLLIINEERSEIHSVTADIYNFVLHENESNFWLFQTIPLDCAATSTATNNFGPYFFLSVPQKLSDCVRIFQYSEDRFIPYQNITSKNVDNIVSFSIGYRSYLAVSGYNFAIYEFTKLGLQKERVSYMNVAEVTYLLVVPIETYRDEVVLLVEHQLDHGSHTSTSVEMIFYSKGQFAAHEEVPCTAYGQFSHGASCIGDEELASGIYGSAALSSSELLGIIVPRYEVHSGLFMIDWHLIEMKDPMVERVEQITKAILDVQKTLAEQEKVAADIEDVLMNSLNSEADNIITGEWTVDTIVAPKVSINKLKQSSRMADEKRDAFTKLEKDIAFLSDEMNVLEDKLLSRRTLRVSEENEIENLTIHGELKVTGKAHINNIRLVELNDENFDEITKDFVRRGEKTKIRGTKVFSKVNAQNITFTKLNNVSADKIAYKSGDTLVINGDLKFAKLHINTNVVVSPGGTVNGFKLDEDLVYMDSNMTYPNIQFENIEVEHIKDLQSLNGADMTMFLEESKNFVLSAREDSGLKVKLKDLYMPHANITAKFVNGENFADLLKDLCLRNLDYHFPGETTIHGNLHVHGPVEIEYLNGLKYPEDYLLKKDSGFTRITGKKTFLGNVSATEVLVNGLVDGVDLKEVITLSLNQTIPGNITISDLEITESMNVDGEILGPNLDNFVPNPTLEESNTLTANVIFEKLEVNGDIIISDKFGETDLKSMLERVVYTDEDNPVITVPKTFSGSVNVKNMYLASNKINDLDIDDILTDNTEQTLSASTIVGPVEIENLEVAGYFNGENMTKLFEEVIRLHEDEEILGNIIFEDYEDGPRFTASELYVERINGFTSSDLVFVTGDRVLSQEVAFDKIKAKHITVLNDLNYGIEGFDIHDYDQYRLSLTRDQTITGKYYIQDGSIQYLEATKINEYDAREFTKFINASSILEERLLNGELEIEELHINASLFVDYVNDYNMKEVFENVFWTDRPNNFTKDLIFQKPVHFKKLDIKYLNDYDFKGDFIDDLVLKNQTDVVFKGHKTFAYGLEIKSELNTNYMNDVKVEDLLIQTGQQTILGPVIIHGDVWVENELDVRDSINNVSIHFLQSTVKIEDGKHIINGDVTFEENVTINNLYVDGLVNGEKFGTYIDNLVSIHDDAIIPGTVIFKDEVIIEKSLDVGNTLDGVKFDEFVKDVVLISSDGFIGGLVTFTQYVNITETLEIETDLDTRYLCGNDLEMWKEKAIRINSYMPGNWTFENVTVYSEMDIEYINDIDMNNIIPLHTDQYIDQDMEFHMITTENDIEVGDFVNGYNLEEEYFNSILKNTDERIDAGIVFQAPVTITKQLKTSGLINGIDLRRLVTTDTDQNLTASYVFTGKVTIDSDMYVSGKVNDIDMAEWAERVVRAHGDDEQNITGRWYVQGNLTFQSDVEGSSLIAGLDIWDVAAQTRGKMQEKYALQEQIKGDYKSTCLEVKDAFKRLKSQIFLFKHFENHQELTFDDYVECVHTYEFEDNYYLLVSLQTSCLSKLYVWNSNYFTLIAEVETGAIEQIITVIDAKEVYLVTKNYNVKGCSYQGVNMWVFNENILTHVHSLEDAIELHFSQLPETFYTLSNASVTEFKLTHEDEKVSVNPFRKWEVPNGKYTFNPHGQPHGFSLRSKDGILKLSRKRSKSATTSDDATTIPGDIVVLPNRQLQFLDEGEVLGLVVGFPGYLQHLTAVATHEQTRIVSKIDTIKIYEDLTNNILFTKIMTYRPSNLVALNFGGNGETILAFLENKKSLKIYEYKGIEGFRHRSSIDIEASKMTTADLPVEPYFTKRSFLLLIQENRVSILQAVMTGDRPVTDVNCDV